MKKEIIDLEVKGNIVRFYLGKNGKQYGDDWNDVPYEHNAGKVYKEFIKGYEDIVFDFDDLLYEPSYSNDNSSYSKEDFVKRNAPCLVVLPKEHIDEEEWDYSYEKVLGNEKSIKFYFGNKL